MTEFSEDKEVTFAVPAVDAPTENVSPQTTPVADPPPVLVQIVSDAVDTRATFERHKLTAEARPIAPYMPGRKRVLIRNLGPNTAYIGADYAVSSVYGFPVPSGASEEWSSEGEFWAACASGETADIGVTMDYELR